MRAKKARDEKKGKPGKKKNIHFNGLLLLLGQFFGNANPPLASDGSVIALWAISVLIVLSIISRLIQERSRQGLVVISQEKMRRKRL